MPAGVALDVRRTATAPAEDNLAMVSAPADPGYLTAGVGARCASGVAPTAYARSACGFVKGKAGERVLREAVESWGAPRPTRCS